MLLKNKEITYKFLKKMLIFYGKFLIKEIFLSIKYDLI